MQLYFECPGSELGSQNLHCEIWFTSNAHVYLRDGATYLTSVLSRALCRLLFSARCSQPVLVEVCTPWVLSSLLCRADSSSLQGRQLLSCLALRPPIGPNALPPINQKPNDKGEELYPPGFVCLLVCLFVSRITEKVMDVFSWNFQRSRAR